MITTGEKVPNDRLKNQLNDLEVILHQLTVLDRADGPEQLNTAIDELLRCMGDYTHAERTYLFAYLSESGIYRNINEWCSKGVTPQIDNLQSVSYTDMPVWHETFLAGGMIIIPELSAVRQTMPAEYRLLVAQDIRTLTAFPLFRKTTLVGFIGLDNVSIERTSIFRSLLSVVGGHLGNIMDSIARDTLLSEQQTALAENRLTLKRERTYLKVLTRDYSSVYCVDLLRDSIEILKLSPTANVDSIFDRERSTDAGYRHILHLYCRSFLSDSEAEELECKLSPENLMRVLRDRERFTCRFHSMPNAAGHEFFEAQVSRMEVSPDSFRVLIGFHYIDDTIREELRRQKQLEDALRDAELQNEIISVISAIYHSIFRIDLTTDTVYFISGSDALRREITPGGVPYARLTDSLDRVTAPEFAERAKKFRDLSTLPERLAQTDSVAFEYRTKGGDWHICRFFVKKRDENGRVTHVLYANRLTSDFILRERNWYVIAEEANRASAAKTDFLSRMAHDIRTPLNALLGFAEIAEQNVNDPERLRDALGKLTLSGRVLKQLVSDIFDVTQLESGQMRLSPENFDVEQLFRGAIEPFREDAERKRQTLVPVCREISFPTLYGDPTRLQQICVNLLSNAIRYTPAGGEIRCEFSEDIAHTSGDVLLRLVVRDNGVGISPDFLPHIFDKFSRSVDTRVNEVRGSGLGLAIVKELVEMMHGTIDIESTPGQGTTVTVCIPFLRSEPDTTNAALPCDGLRVLVAEDNELSYEVAAELLGMYHIRTERAENGAICVERFLSTAPGTFDAILMDLQMPVMNGLDATRTIRGLGRADAAEIPIISMTANASPADMQSCLDAGMTRHLAKPLDIHQLLDALAACCKKPQENRQDPT